MAAGEGPPRQSLSRKYSSPHGQLNTPVLYVENLGSGLINGTNVTLRCDAGSQTVTDYIFSGSKENICSENHVTCNQNLLHFHPITDSDNGNYTCTIQNPISKNTSAPLVLTVQVPVSNVTLSSNATTDLLWVDKDFVSLTCSAFGTNVVYSWSLNGIPLSQDSRYHLSNGNSTLIISPVSRKDNGSFTCTASNSVNNETSKPLKLQLAWFPDGPIVYDITRNGNNLTLLCSWPGGNPAANVTMIFQNINETQQDQVTRNVSYDSSLNEVLICLGAQLGLEVNNSVTIELPKLEEQINSHNSVVAGGSVIMTVILMSNRNGRAFQPRSQILPSTFSWFHLKHQSTPITTGGRFTVISSDYKSSLEITEVTENENGDYECIAENAVGSSTFYFVLNVTAKQESSVNNGLGAGEIAGIVVGVLAGVALIGIIAFFILKSKKKKSKKENTRELSLREDESRSS
ncbi:cell adhesion molecule CEACAM1-like [Rhinophrynus dorsalis]